MGEELTPWVREQLAKYTHLSGDQRATVTSLLGEFFTVLEDARKIMDDHEYREFLLDMTAVVKERYC